MNGDSGATAAIEVAVSAWTDAGQKRTENQDQFLVADLSVQPEAGGLLLQADDPLDPAISPRFALGPRGLLAMVADGMGGAAGGRIASQLAVAWTYHELMQRWGRDGATDVAPFVAALRDAITAANTKVHQHGLSNPQFTGMGSTVTAIGLLGDAFYVAQVGDSRAYLLRAGGAHRLTRDQSLVQRLIDAGALTPEQAASSPHASVLLQALGTASDVQVEVTWQHTLRGDTLLLCSDGLFRVVDDREIAAAAGALREPGLICRALVDLANDRGGPDNVTVVAIRVDGDALQAPDPAEPVAVNAYTFVRA